MGSFERDAAIVASVPGDVARLLATCDRGQGQEALHRAQLSGLLDALALRAKGQPVTASSALEGVVVPDSRRAERIIVGSASALRTRSELELAGYRDAVDHGWTQEWRPIAVGLLLQLHRLLLGQASATGGSLKTADDVVVDRGADGSQRVLFRPVGAHQTPFFLEELLERYRSERERDAHHPLLLIGLAVLDLLVIHPFDDGDGRVARIVTSALLEDAGYGVARCISVEPLIAESDEACCATLLASTHGWHEAEHDPWPWVRYLGTSSPASPRPTGCSPSERPGRREAPRASGSCATCSSRHRPPSRSPTYAPRCPASATVPHASRGRCPHHPQRPGRPAPRGPGDQRWDRARGDLDAHLISGSVPHEPPSSVGGVTSRVHQR